MYKTPKIVYNITFYIFSDYFSFTYITMQNSVSWPLFLKFLENEMIFPEISENELLVTNSKNILIESAYFNPTSVRKTSKYLGLTTDAAYRFERGTDPSITVYAAERAAQLMAELSGGGVVDGTIDVYPTKISEKEITLRFHQVERVLGYTVPNEKITWGKLAVNTPRFVIESDATIVAPLIFNYVLGK